MGLQCRFSWRGLMISGAFLFGVVAAMAWVYFIASRNPVDSGESSIMLVFAAYPWIAMLPVRWLSPAAWAISVMFNALILYALFGGIRTRRAPR